MADPRFFTPTSVGSLVSSLPWIFDPNQVSTDGSTTGVWRAYKTTDIASVSVSGLSVTVGAVAVTGNPQVQVSNSVVAVSGIVHTVVTGSVSSTTDLTPLVNAQVTGNNYLLIANRLASGISGQLAANLTDAAWVTGQVALTNPVTGTYTPNFNIITGSQVTIPTTARSASITVISGGAFINGTGPFPASYTANLGGYNGAFLLGSAVVVGCTGTVSDPSKAIVIWEV